MVLVNWSERQAEPKVHEIKTLGWTGDSDVKAMLQRVASQVMPIMKKRNWRVPLLSEFFPSNPNLLGLNVGGGGGETREVRIRVRYAHDKTSLLHETSVLGTMLHELCHNVRGPHDAVFYKLLDEITEECEQLIAKGITGSGVGFEGPSCGRLGSHAFIPQHNPAPGRLRILAAQAAEARAKRAKLMPQGPHKLGSSTTGAHWRDLTPAQAAAEAASRRAADELWCPCGKLGMPVDTTSNDTYDVNSSHRTGSDDTAAEVQVAPSRLQQRDGVDAAKQQAKPRPASGISSDAQTAAAAAAMTRSIVAPAAGANSQQYAQHKNARSQQAVQRRSNAAHIVAAEAADKGCTEQQRHVLGTVIDLTLDSDQDEVGNHKQVISLEIDDTDTGRHPTNNPGALHWVCGACTFMNSSGSKLCEVCCTINEPSIQSNSVW